MEINHTKILAKINSLAKTILVIEPYGSIVSLIKTAKDKKLNIIFITANKDMRMPDATLLSYANYVIHADTVNEKKILRIVKILATFLHIDAVIPGIEYFVPFASRVAETLNLKCIPASVVMNARNKHYMRDKLAAANLSIPNYFLAHTMDELNDLPKEFNFPLICKPVDAAGSVLVKKVNSAAELYLAASDILLGHYELWGID